MDIVDRRNSRRAHCQALRLRIFLHCLDLNFGVDLAGGVNRTDGLCIRIQLRQEINLIGNRANVTCTRNISARLLIRLHNLRAHIVCDRSADNGNLLRRIRCRLDCRRCNRTNEIHLIADKALDNILEIRLICLCILAINRKILPLLIAARLESVHKSTIRIVERAVLDKLNNTHFICFFTFIRLFAAAC